MIELGKKSASNFMRLIDHPLSVLPGLSPVLARSALACSALVSKSLTHRLENLYELIAYEQSVSSKPPEHLAFYCAVAHQSLTNAFILTQRNAALRRIESSSNPIAQHLLADHASGEKWISVGISHLTTSRQHLASPAVTARAHSKGWSLRGSVPWVTAASGSQALVVAACDSENFSQQFLFYLPMDLEAVQCGPNMDLLALKDSCTCEVHLHGVELSAREILHGPCENVLSLSQSGGAGGLQTTALALGLTACAIDKIYGHAESRSSLRRFQDAFSKQWSVLFDRMLQAAIPGKSDIDLAKLRKDANDLVLRVTQAALAIEKGAGFLENSDVSRWAREALFFLVWSCPQPIADAHLCDFTQFDPEL